MIDYLKLTKTLNYIKDVCNSIEDCDRCPLGNSSSECLLTIDTPNCWNIQTPETAIVRLLD